MLHFDTISLEKVDFIENKGTIERVWKKRRKTVDTISEIYSLSFHFGVLRNFSLNDAK